MIPKLPLSTTMRATPLADDKEGFAGLSCTTYTWRLVAWPEAPPVEVGLLIGLLVGLLVELTPGWELPGCCAKTMALIPKISRMKSPCCGFIFFKLAAEELPVGLDG